MSQICKFYLRGSCKYGHRCHFLHEDHYDTDYSNDRRSSQRNYYRNESYGQNQNYEKDYSQNHSRYNAQNYHANSRSNYRDNTYAGKQNYNRYGSNNDATQQNYDRYHVDRRRPIDSESLSLEDFLEIVNMELIQHHQSHMWPFTVIAPMERFGNIPGFEDLSPEEVRYQYVKSMTANNLSDYVRNMSNALNELMEYRLMFQSKSSQARNILKTMMEGSKSTNMNNVTTHFNTHAASAFSFDLSQLNANRSPLSYEDMNTESGPGFSSNLIQNMNPFSQQENTQGFPGSGTDHHPFTVNQTSTFSFANLPRQSDSQINTFSFSMNHMKSSQENPVQSSGFYCQPVSALNVQDSIYSDFRQLPAESIQQFQAKIFKPGKIPLHPPSRDLCIS